MDKLDLIKTTKTYQTIVDDYQKERLPHCNLLIAPDKMSCELFAIAFASLVVCEDKDEIVIRNITKRIHPDVYFLPRVGTLKVEDVEIVLDRINYFPMQADVKVFVLENFSSATPQAQNKLLKTLEETPANVYFLITSEKEDGILQTIKSRCRRLELEPLSESAINIFMTQYNVDAKRIDVANFYGRGEMGRTDFALQNEVVSNFVDLSFDIIKGCKTSKDLLYFADKLMQNKSDLKLFLHVYADVLNEVLKIQIFGDNNKYETLHFGELKNELSGDAILQIIDKLSLFAEMVERACSSTLIIDNLLIETCRCANLK